MEAQIAAGWALSVSRDGRLLHGTLPRLSSSEVRQRHRRKPCRQTLDGAGRHVNTRMESSSTRARLLPDESVCARMWIASRMEPWAMSNLVAHFASTIRAPKGAGSYAIHIASIEGIGTI
jgi:hypothetical protein